MTKTTETLIRDYLAAIERNEDVARFYTPDAVQEEFPNRFVPNGATRRLDDILAANERGRKVMQRQTYDVHTMVASGELVAVEFSWTGWLAAAVGSLAAGDKMTGRFCMVVELEDGRIKRQRNYDCFDPF